MDNKQKTMDKVIALCKGRGFIFSGSEIYGGLANTWDYGPLGVELKNNVKKAWWKKFVQENPYNVGLDAAILMNPQTWVASGHRGRLLRPADGLQGLQGPASAPTSSSRTGQATASSCPSPSTPSASEEMADFIEEHEIPCPTCGKHNFTDIRQFNLMFKTFQGVTEDAKNDRLPPPGDRPGHLCQLPEHPAHHPQEAALRRLPDRQELPQRDHPGQLHLPHP